MKVTLDINQYDINKGLYLCWENNFKIIIEAKDNEVILSANREGLVSLANHLVNLAQSDVPVGTHIHLDEYNSLEEGSKEIIIQKVE